MHALAVAWGKLKEPTNVFRDSVHLADGPLDVEKTTGPTSLSGQIVEKQGYSTSIPEWLSSRVSTVEKTLVKYNLEVRGIRRVAEDERTQRNSLAYLQAFALWNSINLAPNNVTLGMLGPAVYELSFRDASLCAVFGAIIGSIPVGWIATWGPPSGLRSMVGLPVQSRVLSCPTDLNK